MQIFVKTLRGKTITIDICSNKTILELKKAISDKEWIPIHFIHLTFGTRFLYEDLTPICDYNITKESTIIMRLNTSSFFTSDNEVIEHSLKNNNYLHEIKLNDVKKKIYVLLKNKWKIDRIYKYKFENGNIYNSVERQYPDQANNQKVRIQISLENYIIMYK